MIIPTVGLLGVLGNLCTMLILLRPEMKSSFHQSILSLAIVDLLLVTILILDSFNLDLDLDNQAAAFVNLEANIYLKDHFLK